MGTEPVFLTKNTEKVRQQVIRQDAVGEQQVVQ